MPKRVSLKGKGADLFFGDYPVTSEPDPASPPGASLDRAPTETAVIVDAADAAFPSSPAPNGERPTAPLTAGAAHHQRRPRAKAGTPDSAPASVLASVDASTVEAIRQVIKAPGREVSFVRLTPEEKGHLSDIVYTYKRQGQKTSETEINRIAINYLLLDFHEHGEQSVLARVLAALRA